MKLVTIKCLDVSGPDQDGDMCIKVRFGNQGLADMYVTAGDIVTVEDIPDPLPTEPGVRFWGEAECSDPQWWFTQETEKGEIKYVASQSFVSVHGDKDRCRLVRLPDPEVTK